MTKENGTIEQKLDKIIELLQHLLALELARSGATQQAIGKHIHVAKATVVKMLKGIQREDSRDR
jgi:DNA-binding MarR family transcriptional regulator